ncbi:tRNA synthetases class II-domain-containing protein [Mycena floridula]|nr:tRNA synthetases class II-domain-containing protein [Mycena floridula]
MHRVVGRLPDLCGSGSRLYSQFRAHCAPFPKRSHNCGSVSADLAGSSVILMGWLLPERKGKKFSFFPLKDSSGTVQLTVNNSEQHSHLSSFTKIAPQSAVLIVGTVLLRPLSARRPGSGGDIDVQVDSFTLLNPAEPNLPFNPSVPFNLPNEELRLRYRYLDLRRQALTENLKKRSQVAHVIRNLLHDQEFVEVETPILLRSSPEGAREFLVPTRSSGTEGPSFYALQQSPQQPKQLLICSGAVDKYFQLAKCFRDEDGRKDRQPEFTQVDLEIAYVSWGLPEEAGSLVSDAWRIGGSEVRTVVESLVRRVWNEVEGIELPKAFKVMTYFEAMTRFGSDKPDTRFGLEITSLNDFMASNQRDRLQNIGEVLESIIIRQSEESITLTQENITHWLGNSTTLSDLPASDDPEWARNLNDKLNVRVGDVIWLSRRSARPKGGSTALGLLRLRLLEIALEHEKFELTEEPHFLWVTEFPLFTKADNDKDFLAKGRWSSSHHPFTAPMWQDIESMYRGEIEAVRGQHYDLVLNGVEIGGGSVRVHDASMQNHIFANILQLTDKETEPFAQLIHALQCGAPPHGGIALGFDRLMSILCKTTSIRDVIAFPKTSTGTDLLFQSPASVTDEVLQQYGIEPKA